MDQGYYDNRRGEKRSHSPGHDQWQQPWSDTGYSQPASGDRSETSFEDAVVGLDTYNSDMNLLISKSPYSARPMTNEGFAFVWAGARATHGARKGKVCFEVKVLQHLNVSHLPPEEPSPHVVRLGWSIETTSMQLGEEPMSWGYGGTGKMSTNCQFKNYGTPFMEGDTITCFLNMDSNPIQISFAKNGRHLGIAYKIQRDQIKENALYPHILTKNCEFSVNFGQLPRPEFPLPPGYEDYTMIGCAPTQWLERGTLPPTKKEDCEMLMMCGLPGAGKTTWANKYSAQHPEKKYNVLGTNNLIDKMKVMGLPRKRNYAGRWDVLIQKSTKCLNKLMEMGSHTLRNFILDQTNVYPSAQKRKMRAFEGFVRKAVVLVPTDEEFERRVAKRESEEGKDVPDSAVLEMKANFGLPTAGQLFDEVLFVELPKEEAEPLVKQYNEEGTSFTGPKKRLNQDQQNNKWTASPSPATPNSRGQWDGNRGGFRDGNRGGGRGRGSYRGRDSSPATGDRGGFNRSDQYGSPPGSSPQSGNDSWNRGSSQYQSSYGHNSPSQQVSSRDHSPFQRSGGDMNRGSRDSYSDQPYNQLQQQDQWKPGGRGGYQEGGQSRFQEGSQSKYQEIGQSRYQESSQSRYQEGGQSRYQDSSQSRYNQQGYDQSRNNQRDQSSSYGQQKFDQPRYGQQAPDRPRDSVGYNREQGYGQQGYDQSSYNRNQQGLDQGGYNRGYDQPRNPVGGGSGGPQQFSQSSYGQSNDQSNYGQGYNQQYGQGGYEQQQQQQQQQPQQWGQQPPPFGYQQQAVPNQGYGGYSQYK